jgi:iron complex outermembrane recepter protein
MKPARAQTTICYLFITVLLGLCTVANAQTVLSAKLVDESENLLSNVSVHLLRKKDSTVIKLTATRADGSFKLTIPNDSVLLKFTAVGYHTSIQDPSALNSYNSFTLRKSTQNLGAVTVKATRPLFQFLPDKTVVNIEAAPSNAGNSLFDILQKLPDVLADQDGNISINGKQGAVVLIDGRETFLSGQQLVNLLRNMASSSVDQVEIISNPSARYDAVFSGGILNIKTQKGKTEGFNGNLSPSAGVQVYQNPQGKTKAAFVSRNSINYNYRRNKLSVYGGAGYDRSFYYENFRTNRFFFTGATLSPAGNYFSASNVKTPGNAYSFRVAVDYTLSKYSLIGIGANNVWDNNTSVGGSNSHVATNDNKLEYLMRSTLVNPGSYGYFGNYNVNYKYENPKSKVDFFSDLNFLNYTNNSRTENKTEFIDTLNKPILSPLLRKQDAKNGFVGVVFKADALVKKIGAFKFEPGYKLSFIQTTNDPVFLRQMGGNGYSVDASRTIYFRYSETIHALYGMLSRTYKNTELQAGLRLEDASGKGYQRNNDSSFTRHWLNLFPSAFLRRKVSTNYQFVLSYSRRVTRPSARNLSPFAYFTDSLYSNTGNPYIQPQFAHVAEWRNIIKNKFTITASFQQVSDMIMFMIAHEPVNKTIRATVYNFDTYRTWNLSAALPLRISKAWQANVNLAAGLTQAKGEFLNLPINQKVGYGSVAIANVFTFSSLWGADVNLNYTSPQLSGLLEITRPLIYSVGIRKKTKDNLGSLTLSMQTPFFVPRYDIDVSYSSTVYNSRFHLANQSFMLTYSLRFGKQTVAQQRNKANAAAEEERRM